MRAAVAGRLSARRADVRIQLDYPLLAVCLGLLGLGWIMVASASIGIADREFGNPLFFAYRQGIYILIALSIAGLALKVPMRCWEQFGIGLLLVASISLILVLIPGVGREVNGSARWIPLGVFNLQVSEPVKLLTILYLAGYLVRRNEEVRTYARGFIKPMAVLAFLCMLLLMEPDFGAAAVLLATALIMMFLAGVRWWQYAALMAAVGTSLAALAVSAPYRVQRLTAFLNPWADPFDSGFQLTQSLIAFGRGEWFGVGLGSSVQKLFYLPEAHTDFLFAVLAEELGLLVALVVIAMYGFLLWRAFAIGQCAENSGKYFGAYTAYGIGGWLGLQSVINMGVSMGLLPTKGLTLPLLSYGGSSLVISILAIGILLRVDIENRTDADVSARSLWTTLCGKISGGR